MNFNLRKNNLQYCYIIDTFMVMRIMFNYKLGSNESLSQYDSSKIISNGSYINLETSTCKITRVM
jgi:hypothetical protein